MIFFRFMFMLLLAVPMAIFMIYLLGRMIDALNVSIKNDTKEKEIRERSYKPDAKFYEHRRGAEYRQPSAQRAGVRAVNYDKPQKEKGLKSGKPDSKRKRRKERKMKRNKKKDREQ